MATWTNLGVCRMHSATNGAKWPGQRGRLAVRDWRRRADFPGYQYLAFDLVRIVAHYSIAKLSTAMSSIMLSAQLEPSLLWATAPSPEHLTEVQVHPSHKIDSRG